MIEASPADTVIVVCSCSNEASDIVEQLSARGFSVIGPVDRASSALALAAQSPVTLAVLDTKLAGRRGGGELASQLMSRWGATSILLKSEPGDEAWEASGELAGLVRDLVSARPAASKPC